MGFALQPSEVALVFPVKACDKKRMHPWHLCRPGGFDPWVCPGVGTPSLTNATLRTVDTAAIRPMRHNLQLMRNYRDDTN